MGTAFSNENSFLNENGFSNGLNRDGFFSGLNEDGFNQETLTSHTCFERRYLRKLIQGRRPAAYQVGGVLLSKGGT
jgi:hypothetical protein